jgi:DNA gyrase subunit B
LEELSKNFLTMNAIKSRLASHYNQLFLDKLLIMERLSENDLIDNLRMSSWVDILTECLNKEKNMSLSFEVMLMFKEDNQFDIHVHEIRHGVMHNYIIPHQFFSSGDYTTMMNFASQLDGLLTLGEAYVERGDKRCQVDSFEQAHAWLFNESKRGQHIQRYKGLGEMNPEQLWETTLDANVRRLLQVRIEDAVAADEIFTTLMGDHVEPRREFIEKNALSVSNIDI